MSDYSQQSSENNTFPQNKDQASTNSHSIDQRQQNKRKTLFVNKGSQCIQRKKNTLRFQLDKSETESKRSQKALNQQKLEKLKVKKKITDKDPIQEQQEQSQSDKISVITTQTNKNLKKNKKQENQDTESIIQSSFSSDLEKYMEQEEEEQKKQKTKKQKKKYQDIIENFRRHQKKSKIKYLPKQSIGNMMTEEEIIDDQNSADISRILKRNIFEKDETLKLEFRVRQKDHFRTWEESSQLVSNCGPEAIKLIYDYLQEHKEVFKFNKKCYFQYFKGRDNDSFHNKYYDTQNQNENFNYAKLVTDQLDIVTPSQIQKIIHFGQENQTFGNCVANGINTYFSKIIFPNSQKLFNILRARKHRTLQQIIEEAQEKGVSVWNIQALVIDNYKFYKLKIIQQWSSDLIFKNRKQKYYITNFLDKQKIYQVIIFAQFSTIGIEIQNHDNIEGWCLLDNVNEFPKYFNPKNKNFQTENIDNFFSQIIEMSVCVFEKDEKYNIKFEQNLQRYIEIWNDTSEKIINNKKCQNARNLRKKRQNYKRGKGFCNSKKINYRNKRQKLMDFNENNSQIFTQQNYKLNSEI